MSLLNVSETIRASDFKISHSVGLDSLYIWTGNDVTSYFRSAANRIDVLILGHVWIVVSQSRFNRFQKSLETVVQGLHFLLCNLLDIFAP